LILSQEEPLKVSSPLTGLGGSEEEALIVAVPSSTSSTELAQIDMRVDMPPFEPSKYKLEYPFFVEDDSDKDIDLLGRDDVIQEINSIISDRAYRNKYFPIVISTSRGMGKTFLLKKFGRQEIKDHLKTDAIGKAISTGRILCFDFSSISNAISTEDDIYKFFPRLMVYFLCRIFDGTQVDGINFQKSSFQKSSPHADRDPNFRKWLNNVSSYDTEDMMREYIRLTNIAFGTTDDTPPVFLLDEIQKLCRATTVESSFENSSGPQMHTQLSLLLSQLVGNSRPVCICTGTNNGRIISITEKSTILPKVLSLSPLMKEYKEFWRQRTVYSNKLSPQYCPVEMDPDKDLIDALVYASYQIPRLLYIAHCVWFDLRRKGITSNRDYFIQAFDKIAVDYYREMGQIDRKSVV